MSKNSAVKTSRIDFYITMDCNEKCAHCYALPRHITPEKMTQKDYPWLDIPLDFMKRILDEAAELRDQDRLSLAQHGKKNENLEQIEIFGGEPFLRYNELLLPVIEYAVSKGFSIGIITNGFWGMDSREAKQKLDQINRIVRQSASLATYEDSQKNKIIYTPTAQIHLSCDGMRSPHLIKASANIAETYIRGQYPNLSFFIGSMMDVNKEGDTYLDHRNRDAQQAFLNALVQRGIHFSFQKISEGFHDLHPTIIKNNRLVHTTPIRCMTQGFVPVGRTRALEIAHAKRNNRLPETLKAFQKFDREKPSFESRQGYQLVFVPCKNGDSHYVKACYDMRDIASKKRGVVCGNKSLDQIISEFKTFAPLSTPANSSIHTSQKVKN